MSSAPGANSPDADTEELRRVERALEAFDPDDRPDRVRDLLEGLLAYAAVADHPPMLLARTLHNGAGRIAALEPGLPPEVETEEAYAQLAGRTIGALWYLSTHMVHIDPMDLQARAHRALADHLDAELN